MKIKYLNTGQFIIIIFSSVLSFNFLFSTKALAQTTKPEMVACTMDAMMCPDGSYVGRTGPKCEFVCPNISVSTTSNETNGAGATTTAENSSSTPPQETDSVATKPVIKDHQQSALTEANQKRITNLSANISNRLDAVVARLFNIITRIESRIILLKQQGFNTSNSESELRNATAKLVNAKNLLTKIDTLVLEAVTSEQPYTSWQTVRIHYEEIMQLIREAYASLKETVTLLKEVSKNPQSGETNLEKPDTSNNASSSEEIPTE